MKKARVDNSKLVDRLHLLAEEFNADAANANILTLAENCGKPAVISTGFPELDHKILVIGGIPRGRVVEIAGKTSAGKSTLAVNIMRNAARSGCRCVYADKEGTMTYEYGESIGIDRHDYLIYKGNKISGAEYLENVLRIIEAGADLVILDSMSMIGSEEVSDTSLTDVTMHTEQSTAKLSKNFILRLFSGWRPRSAKYAKLAKDGGYISILDTNCTLIIINHLKDAFGPTYGKPEMDSRGGETIKFAYSMRIWLVRYAFSKEERLLDEEGYPLYAKVRVTCAKNKLGPPGRSTIMWLNNKTGQFMSDGDNVLNCAMQHGIITKQGNNYYFTSDYMRSKAYSSFTPDWEEGLGTKVNAAVLIMENHKLFSYVMRKK